ncbi:E3 ubiquitin-protein ligase BRE1-like 2 [Mycena kentingensis (nom. inval.)]|nr:E3 ubiquitin-protein ligase BRE1-like 2 [Mycena kentingensis (nom. inval.)]
MSSDADADADTSFCVKYCSLCDQYFYSAAQLKAHITAASPSRHPKCVPCGRSFLNNNSLRNHYVLSSHHHYCRICQKHFKTAAGLRIHLDFSHDASDDEDDGRPEGWEDQRGYEEDLALLARDGGGDGDDEIPIPEEDLILLPPARVAEAPAAETKGSGTILRSVPARLRLRCPICLSSRKGLPMSSTRCGHVFCSACIVQVLEETRSCPSCRQPAISAQLRALQL